VLVKSNDDPLPIGALAHALFPPESALFKVKCDFPELRPPNAQNAVKIVPVIFPVICDKRNLRTDSTGDECHDAGTHEQSQERDGERGATRETPPRRAYPDPRRSW